ncbi:MAG: methyltransferase domain-containing protein [Acidobacteriota bacterium]
MTEVTQSTVTAFFDRESEMGRRLLPDPATVSGLGSYRKYEQAASMMAEPGVRDALDVGCNRGSIEYLFHSLFGAKSGAKRIEGVDVSEKAIEQARELALPNCTFRSYDGSRLPFGDAEFDLAVLVEVLEHVPNKKELLGEISRVLRPGGRLFLTTPNPFCWALRAELGTWRQLRRLFRRPAIAKDLFVSIRDLVELLHEAGFSVPDPESLYSWPHLYFFFLGWSVVPPLPPKALTRYQSYCVRALGRRRLPEWLSRRLHWTLSGVVTKSNG